MGKGSKQTSVGGNRWEGWEQYLVNRALEPSERVTGTGSPSPSVFSLHGFVCGLSETFQESHSPLHSGKGRQKQECRLLESFL